MLSLRRTPASLRTGRVPRKDILTQLYLGYRHYELDVDLLGAGGSVPTRDFEDLDVVMAGITVHWGGVPAPVCEPAGTDGGASE